MEVGEVGDPEPVQLVWQLRHRQLEHAQPNPARLERAPAQSREHSGTRGDGLPATGPQTSIFSSIGFTDTTCRLNLSSDSWSPAATPTSCERWRIGILKSRPVSALSFDCHASSDR